MEEKVRRHDLLVGEEEMAQFYEKRLPGISDIRSLQRLIRDKGSDGFLRMDDEDLLVKPPDPGEIALFPSAVSAGGWRLDCVYRFDPGKPLDGVTLKIPVHAVPSLPAASLDWAIPGLLKEKVLALLKGLPKEYRKKLQPLNQTCEILLGEMERAGPLPTALGRAIFRKFGIDIPVDRWPLEELDEHLKLRYAVVDEKDRELAAGRDISILRQELVGERESQAFAKARLIWEKSGLTGWDFGDLPERITLTAGDHNAPVAFPALFCLGCGDRHPAFSRRTRGPKRPSPGGKGTPGSAFPRRAQAPAQVPISHRRSEALGGRLRGRKGAGKRPGGEGDA